MESLVKRGMRREGLGAVAGRVRGLLDRIDSLIGALAIVIVLG